LAVAAHRAEQINPQAFESREGSFVMRAVEYALAHHTLSLSRAADEKLDPDVRKQWQEVASAWKKAADQIGYFEEANARTEISPSIVPDISSTHYFVLDDFGQYGCLFHERREHETSEDTVIRHLIEGQFQSPLRVLAFNAEEGWSRDVSAEIAEKVLLQVEKQHGALTSATRAFVERHLGFSIDQAAVS
jgi:hypothetical protein